MVDYLSYSAGDTPPAKESGGATAMAKSSDVARLLDLRPHPEGGFFSETFRDHSISLPKSLLPDRYKVERPISTSIYFLLPSGNVSHLHRIPMAETWHFYMGDPLTVFELYDDGSIKFTALGLDLEAGQRPQYTVQPNVWFGSYPTMDIKSYSSDGRSLVKAEARDSEKHFSLVGCTCAPAFQFEDFELGKRSSLIALAPKAENFISYLTWPE